MLTKYYSNEEEIISHLVTVSIRRSKSPYESGTLERTSEFIFSVKIFYRGRQTTAHGPNVIRHVFLSGPWIE